MHATTTPVLHQFHIKSSKTITVICWSSVNLSMVTYFIQGMVNRQHFIGHWIAYIFHSLVNVKQQFVLLIFKQNICSFDLLFFSSPVLQLTTEELWAFCLYMMSQTNRPSIVCNMHVHSHLLTEDENASHFIYCFFVINLQTLEIGFATQSSTHLIMSTRSWWATRLIWMQSGYMFSQNYLLLGTHDWFSTPCPNNSPVNRQCPQLKVRSSQMNMGSSFLRR